MTKSLGLAYTLSILATALQLAGCSSANESRSQMLPLSAAHALPQTSSSFRVLYRFIPPLDRDEPQGKLLDIGGTLYGTASGGDSCNSYKGCGIAYTVTPNGAEKVIFDFDIQDGSNPLSGLIDVNGTLYGTTLLGGSHKEGTVYSLTTSGSESVLHNFEGPDGAQPYAGLIKVNGTLYGTTANGGKYNDGSVYSISTSGAEMVLYSFAGGSDGSQPVAPLSDVNGTLYGTTQNGGAGGCKLGGCGTAYSITTKGVHKVLYSFACCSDGRDPSGALLDVGGTLYGTTAQGGSSEKCTLGCGTVYSITTSGSEKVLYNFGTGDGDGWEPQGGLIDVNGTLYGVTQHGGTVAGDCNTTLQDGCGTVYSLSTSGAEQVIHTFTGGKAGSSPVAPLLYVKGTLYGTTLTGGTSHVHPDCCGTIFALTP